MKSLKLDIVHCSAEVKQRYIQQLNPWSTNLNPKDIFKIDVEPIVELSLTGLLDRNSSIDPARTLTGSTVLVIEQKALEKLTEIDRSIEELLTDDDVTIRRIAMRFYR